jgi:hypothetical protein
MTMLRLLPAAVAAAAVFAAAPASAEMKKEWVEYSQGGMKLKAYMAYDDKITGKRPASSGPNAATCRLRPTSSATARASCRRTSRR